MLVGAAVAFGVTLAAAPVVLAALRRWRVIDDPNWRSSHTIAVPRGGGIAIAVGVTVALGLGPGLPFPLRAGLLAVGLGAGVVGLADDVTRGTSPKLRLVAIIAAAAASLVWLDPASASSGLTRIVVIVLCLGWVASYVNAFNFMDGINGISAGQVLVVAGQVAVTALLSGQRGVAGAGLIVAASAVAFVPFNFPRARMFLGDVGSYLLGGLVSGLVIAAIAEGIPVDGVATGAALYAGDTFITLLRRVVRGEVWHQAHREHVYQRLTDAGLSHVTVTGLVTGLSLLCAALGIAGAETGGLTRLAAGAAVVVITASYAALPAIVTRGTPLSGQSPTL